MRDADDGPGLQREPRELREEHVALVRGRLDPESDGLPEEISLAMDAYLAGEISLSRFADDVGALFLIVALPRTDSTQ